MAVNNCSENSGFRKYLYIITGTKEQIKPCCDSALWECANEDCPLGRTGCTTDTQPR